MFLGCISGLYGKGFGVFWEKSWGTITKESYSEHIVPKIAEYMAAHSGLQFQQDNAGGHAAAFTMETMAMYGLRPIFWPSNSPDLNPIETLWNDMKNWIQEHYPEIHRSYRRLRATVEQAWEAIPHERIIELIESMPARCQAVIDAHGGEIKY